MDFEEDPEETVQKLRKEQLQAKQVDTYIIRPNFQRKFKKLVVEDIIQETLSNMLHEQVYDAHEVPVLTQNIANTIKNELSKMEYDRYKFAVQCVIGEQRGEAVKMACRCFWDSDTDNYAQGVYVNNHMFCVAAAFGIYFY